MPTTINYHIISCYIFNKSYYDYFYYYPPSIIITKSSNEFEKKNYLKIICLLKAHQLWWLVLKTLQVESNWILTLLKEPVREDLIVLRTGFRGRMGKIKYGSTAFKFQSSNCSLHQTFRICSYSNLKYRRPQPNPPGRVYFAR